jgi:hypothetical protein
MSGPVTTYAERDEIFFDVISKLAARAEVMNLKISRRATILAAPPVAREHLSREPAIGVGFKAQPRLFPFELVQDCS